MKIKLFTALILSLFLTLGARAEDITFTAISNANIKSDKANNSMTLSISRLLKAKDDINSSGSDFVVFLGDNVQSADKYDLVMFGKIINKIKKPVYTGIGNQDIQRGKGLTKQEYYRLLNKFSKNKTRKVPSAKNIGKDWYFVFMDGINEIVPMQRGYFRDSDLIALKKLLDKNKTRKVVIIQHFPLYYENKDKEAYRGEEYKKLLSNYKNITAVISSHYKEEGEFTDENGVKHIFIPALSNGSYDVIDFREFEGKTLIHTKTITLE